MWCSFMAVHASSRSLSNHGLIMVMTPPDSVVWLLESCSTSQDKAETMEAVKMCWGTISMLARY